MPHQTFWDKSTGRYVNFSSVGELWNRAPDENRHVINESGSIIPPVPTILTPLFFLFGTRENFNSVTEEVSSSNTGFGIMYSDYSVVPMDLPSDWNGGDPTIAGDEGGFYKNFSYLSNKTIIAPIEHDVTNDCYSIFANTANSNDIQSIKTAIRFTRSNFNSAVIGVETTSSNTVQTIDGVNLTQIDNSYIGGELGLNIVEHNETFWSVQMCAGFEIGQPTYDYALYIVNKSLSDTAWTEIAVIDSSVVGTVLPVYVGFTTNKIIVIFSDGKYVYSSDQGSTWSSVLSDLSFAHPLESVKSFGGKLYITYLSAFSTKNHFCVLDDNLSLTEYYLPQDIMYDGDGPYQFNNINNITFDTTNAYILSDDWAIFKINDISDNTTWEFIPTNTYGNTIFQVDNNTTSYQTTVKDFIYIGE